MPRLEDEESDDSQCDLFLSKGEKIYQLVWSNGFEDPYPLSEEEEKIMLGALVDYESNITEIFQFVRLN